jgi:hypothetical protein
MMPSSAYYHRQADTLLALATSTSNPELSVVCRNLAIEYKLLAEKAPIDPGSAQYGAPIRRTEQAEADDG